MPKAVVTDQNIALMNAVTKVFPSSNALFCRYHITTNVRSQVKPTIGTKQVEVEGAKLVKKVYEKYPALLKYIESTILDQLNEKIVCAWTDNVQDLENTTTDKVESAHASLKNWLGNSKGDLCYDWDSVNIMIKHQHNEIQTTFGRSITVLEHQFKDNILYSQLISNMSRSELNYIFHEAKQGETVGSVSEKCDCTTLKTYGIPCACVIAKMVKLGEPIRIDEVFPHWKRTSFEDDGCMEGGKLNISILTELKAIQEIFSKADENMKLHIKEQ
ncbi:uncharacterized protein LOC131630415 [Vicia villosa]|uniref:uncharacterized protein LOC131630415 n=1 Tax=Vicia villosa TaxID=3911 RepID=UPI00273A97EA|nr:uncharacterized protein LOC131630415 [Vicia villosa]